jgi:hypothetical protein
MERKKLRVDTALEFWWQDEDLGDMQNLYFFFFLSFFPSLS